MESSKLHILSINSSLTTSDFKNAKMNVVSLFYFLFRRQNKRVSNYTLFKGYDVLAKRDLSISA